MYTHTEIASIYTHAAQPTRRAGSKIAPNTLQMIFLVLYGTGATSAEVLALRYKDVDLRKKLLCLYNSQYKRSRSIPLNDQVMAALNCFIKRCPKEVDAHVFVDVKGAPIRQSTLRLRFKALCETIPLVRSDGYDSALRLTDIRHTFAVHRIAGWIQDDADLNSMLPLLSAYMGSLNLLSSEYYLRLTPSRYKKYLDVLCPNKGGTHWKDEHDVMSFVRTI
ncbi:tyrosine-type recombinase/integrase [Granulicella paludicola]|uniref:tyrosine-type recombinase/integrase n=1 Tax=Granulicella paludicola TaxID=474951 RepID=UPI0021E09959|nr:tyrosine-type recombinase/integrase [Granulicella paludicola]